MGGECGREGVGRMEWSGGGEWDNCNSIINKYIKKKARFHSNAKKGLLDRPSDGICSLYKYGNLGLKRLIYSRCQNDLVIETEGPKSFRLPGFYYTILKKVQEEAWLSTQRQFLFQN